MKKLDGKVVIITGSSRGIGKATALLFAKEGAKIVVNSRSSENEGRQVVESIKSKGGEAIYIRADISNPKEVKKLFRETLTKFNTLDVLINNAGIVRPKPFLDSDISDWDSVFSVNVYGTFLCAQHAAKIMIPNKHGKILNISSIRGLSHCGRAGIIDYSASKSAVINFTKTLAKELSPYNINVNAVAPGFTETEMSKFWDKKVKESAVSDAYLKRLVQPEEIAGALLYLASDYGNAVTGEVIVVDAGYQLK